MILFYDVETTGRADFKAPPEADHQPRIVQVCGALFDAGTREPVECYNAILKPDGYVIPPEVVAIHGISTDKALKYGSPRRHCLQDFNELAGEATRAVAFNREFDFFVITGENRREGFPNPLADVSGFCVMLAMAPVCRIRKPWGATPQDPWKWPKLSEAYVKAFGKMFDVEHDAMADLIATSQLYFWLQDEGLL